MIEIHGQGDDLVVVRGDATGEVGDGDPITIGTAAGGVVVRLVYSEAVPVWRAEIRQLGEGISIPWPVTISNAAQHGWPNPKIYSVKVAIDCPLGTPITGGKFSRALVPPYVAAEIAL